MPPVLSEFAERALIGIADADSTAEPEYAILRVSSIAEVYVDELLEALSSRHLSDTTTFERAVADLVGTQLRQSWSERRKWLNTFGVALSGQSVSQDFDLVVDLRNAIAHGGGRITHLQRKSLAKQLSLLADFERKLGAHADGDRVTCTEATVQKAIKIVSQYVCALDDAAGRRQASATAR